MKQIIERFDQNLRTAECALERAQYHYVRLLRDVYNPSSEEATPVWYHQK